MKNKIQALANFLEVELDELNASTYDDCVIEYGSEEYLVLTDDEAEQRWDESIDNYIDDCIFLEVPQHFQNYFDRDAFKYDCKFDGRGYLLATYDGHENEEGDFYIYRIN